MQGVHRRSGPDQVLFAQVKGGRLAQAPATEYSFKKAMKSLARAAGMNAKDVERLRGHSLRAGGATDYLSSGTVSDAWVQRQGGWLSPVYRIYFRPAEADVVRMAGRIKATAHESTEEEFGWT